MERTRELVYLQDDDDVEEAMKTLEEQGQQALLDYLLNCGKKSQFHPADTFTGYSADSHCQLGQYIMYWNKEFGYVGVIEIYND